MTGAAQPLPIEIGFLANHGCPTEILRYAAALAAVDDVSPDAVLIKHGLIGEDAFYRALAAELGLPFTRLPRLGSGADFPNSILAGLAPLAPPMRGWVTAPEGLRLQRILAMRGNVPTNFVVTTPTGLRQAVLRRQMPAIARRAAHQLAERAPHLSTRDSGSGAQLALLCAAAASLSFGAGLAPNLAMAVAASLLAPTFLTMVGLRLAAAAIDNPPVPRHPPTRAAEAALPVYSIIVALYQETRVVARLVGALSRLDYPRAKLDIKFVIEADDSATAQALATHALPGFMEIIVAPAGLPRTKPRALNIALPLARGAFTVVYDAEDVPQEGQLRLAVARFADQPAQVACLQARLVIDNISDSWLTRLFAIEYATLFDVINPGLAGLDSPVPLGGTSNHFRTSALRNILGWDAWNVTEDADIGIRLARLGYRVADLPSATFEEAPVLLRAWMHQRSRWMKGYIQTCITHSQTPVLAWRELGFWRLNAAVTLTFGTVLSALGYPIFMAICLARIGAGRFISADSHWALVWSAGSLALFALGLAAMMVPACIGLKRRRLWPLLAWVPLLPIYYLLVSVAAWRAVGQLARNPFHWNKTAHGLARTSRTGALKAVLPSSSRRLRARG